MDKTTAEMWELASALHLHGADVEKLSRLLPHWEKSDIASILRRFKGKARRERHIIEKGRKAFRTLKPKKLGVKIEENVCKLDSQESVGQSSSSASDMNQSLDASLVTWSELLHKVHALEGTTDKLSFGVRIAKCAPIKDHSQMLSKALLYTSCMEDHYQGGSADEASYSEIYRYLSQLLAGEELTQVRPKTAAKILEMVDRLTAAIRSGAFKDAISTLRQKDLFSIQEFQVKPREEETIPASAQPSTSNGGLFEDVSLSVAPTASLKEEIEALNPEHPYFEEHRDKLNGKLKAAQASTASRVRNVPGMNPLDLPSSVMTKPLKAFGEHYPCRGKP